MMNAVAEAATPDRCYTARELAAFLRITEKSLRNLAREGKVPAPLMVGRKMRWPAAAVRAWVNNGKSQGAQS